ncbi:MAG: 50S ribosomal protein L10 [Archaeoglobaceae archaeon]
MAAVKDEIPQWKLETLDELKNIFSTYPVVGIVSFRDVPARQMQELRRDFKEIGVIKVTKNSIIEKALDSNSNGVSKLRDYLGEQIAIIGADINPFKLYKKLEENKVPTPLKPGQVSPIDVEIKKGPTSFPPGPIIGELQSAGLPAAIEKGKIVIKNNATLIREGDKVDSKVARGLELLEIKPSRIGLDVKVLYEDGVVFTPDVLSLDLDKVFEDFQSAYNKALNLAVNSAYVVPETAEILITKAYSDARNLAVNAGIFEKDVMDDMIAKSHQEMLSLASYLPSEAMDDELLEKTSSAEVETPQTETKAEQEEEEEEEEAEEEGEEEEEEEDAAEGLGALFG